MDRYNPQSIEKQAKKWPVLFFNDSLKEEFNGKIKQINDIEKIEWAFPIVDKRFFSSDYVDEYGIDVCRFAILSSEGKQKPNELLDSAYKQIAKIYDSIFFGKKENHFDEKNWFRCIIQSYDHAVIRNKPALAVATLNFAVKHSIPFAELSESHLSLVVSALYPFAPILSKYISNVKSVSLRSVSQLFKDSPYMGVKYRIFGGGWHKEVFDKESFLKDSIREFFKLKCIKNAAGNRNIELNHTDGGIEIVFA